MLLQIEDNRLTITGTDLEVELSSYTQLSSSTADGSFNANNGQVQTAHAEGRAGGRLGGGRPRTCRRAAVRTR